MEAQPYYVTRQGLVPAGGRLLSGNFHVAAECLQLLRVYDACPRGIGKSLQVCV